MYTGGMKDILPWLVAGVILLGGAFYFLYGSIYNDEQSVMADQGDGNVEIRPIEHASFVLRWGEVYLFVDPVDAEVFSHEHAPNLILVTDIHDDHFSPSTLAAVRGEAEIVAPQAVVDALPDELKEHARVLRNDESFEYEGLKIIAMPAYNLPDAENARFHVKGRGNGYVIERVYEGGARDYRVYIAGDTAGTPEMRALKDVNVAFIPMNLPYTMGIEEAVDAVLEFKPRLVYPYHYRTPEGYSDVEKFAELVSAGGTTTVQIATWYPNDPDAPKFDRGL